MLRFSSFTIVSERLPRGGHVLMNGCSGALDLIPEHLAMLIKQVLDSCPHGHAFVAEDGLDADTVASFVERGHLTRLVHDQEKALVSEIARGLHDLEVHRPYFMIAPNMDCNYRCTYCFERHIQKRLNAEASGISYRKGNVVMRREAVPRIYESIESIQRAAGNAPGGMIILYGGEPLDGDHRDLIFDIAYAGRDRGYWFAAITNGHDLDKFLPIMRPDMLNQIQVSIDGPKHVHDKRRIHRGRESSFDKIIANVRAVLDQGGVEVQIRVHVDPSNIGLFEEVLRFFDGERWTDHPNVVIYANTVYDKEKDGRVCVDMAVGEISRDLSHIAARYGNVYTSAPSVHAARALQPVFAGGERFALKGTYCSANFGNYIFAPDGHVYACWESIGKECSRIGSYLLPQGLVLDESALSRWFTRSVAEIPECMECEFALVCGGGCAQYAEYNTGSSYRSYCDDFQRTFRIALAEQLEAHLVLTPTCAPMQAARAAAQVR